MSSPDPNKASLAVITCGVLGFFVSSTHLSPLESTLIGIMAALAAAWLIVWLKT